MVVVSVSVTPSPFTSPVRVTVAPAIPSSPASWIPFALRSWNTKFPKEAKGMVSGGVPSSNSNKKSAVVVGCPNAWNWSKAKPTKLRSFSPTKEIRTKSTIGPCSPVSNDHCQPLPSKELRLYNHPSMLRPRGSVVVNSLSS